MDINFEFRKGLLFVRLEGKLSSEEAFKLSSKLDYFINNKGVKYFVINLEKVVIEDNNFYKMLMDKYNDVKLHDGNLIICGYENSYLNDCSFIQTDNELKAFKLIEV